MRHSSSYIALVLLTLMTYAPAQGWEFTTGKDGWVVTNNISLLKAQDGILVANVAANIVDPYINGPHGPWNAADITGILLRVRTSTDTSNYSGGAGPAIYYFTPSPFAKGFLLPAPGVWASVLVDMTGETNWTGTISNIRVDLADSVPEAYTVEFDWIRYMGLYLNNESFELWDDVEKIVAGWTVIGGSFADCYEANVNAGTEPENVRSLDWAVKHLGTGQYHALSQPIKGGLELEKGIPVTLRGALKVPAQAWDADASIWFRIREFDGTTERLSAPIPVAVFDEWFDFESTLQLAYTPAQRQALDVQLYGRMAEGAFFYFDDIFVEIGKLEHPDENLYWPFNKTHWEFNTPGDTEGWSPKNNTDITFFDVNQVDVDGEPVGALLMDLPAGTFDPYVNGPAGPYYSNRITGIAARMRFNGTASDMVKPADGGQNTVYWFYVAGGHGNGPQFEIPGADEWFIAYMDCSERWSSWISSFRFDLGHYKDYMMVDVDWIRTYGDYITNGQFEEALEPWSQVGTGFSLSSERAQTGATALKIEGQGVGVWHAVEQRLDGWDTRIPKGAKVTVRGSYYVPASSWADGAYLWLRINELQAGTTNENLAPSPLAQPVLDKWTPFEGAITTRYEPSDRGHLSVQLFSQTPAGAPIYVDDVFVEVIASSTPQPESTWPVNCVRLAEGQEIAIDGNVSAQEYSGAQALVLNAETLDDEDPYFPGVVHQGTVVQGPAEYALEDYSGTFYFMWDDTYFYAAVWAQDDAVSPALDAPNGADCLQFVLGAAEAVNVAEMLIPTIAPDDGTGRPKAMNTFSGWLAKDLYAAGSGAEYASTVDAATQDWMVEVRIPWTALQGSFSPEVFPPTVGTTVGFSLLGIDYDNGALEWFGCIENAPWAGLGLQTMTFIEQ
jgi:hypothetical protein